MKPKSPHDGFRMRQTAIANISIYIVIILLLSNLNAIVDSFLHPEIPYFDHEHLIVGGITGFFGSIVGLIILGYIDRLQKIDEEKAVLLSDLVVAKDQAEQHDRLKSAFLANMSHEIRTPMNGILGFASLLQEEDLSKEDQQHYLKIIEQSGYRMLNIINDIIDISKIESGSMKVSVSETNIDEQIDYIYTFFKPETDSKGLQLKVKKNLPANLSVLKTDREKVYAILMNLVKNAIKYTAEGSIEIGYALTGSLDLNLPDLTREKADGKESFLLYVKDSGIGIPKNKQTIIFDRFVQVDATNKMAPQGAGLGLTISKAFVELLGGKIGVESEEGKGSVFYFTLPYRESGSDKTLTENMPDKKADDVKLKKLNILIAEDEHNSEILIETVVKKIAAKIVKTADGPDTIRTCREHPELDLILLDIQMPELDGYEVAREIRKFNPDVVIIAQTAFALSDDKQKAIDAGCNDYIAKPIRKNELIELIQKYFELN